jgi:hypothetical protein
MKVTLYHWTTYRERETRELQANCFAHCLNNHHFHAASKRYRDYFDRTSSALAVKRRDVTVLIDGYLRTGNLRLDKVL